MSKIISIDYCDDCKDFDKKKHLCLNEGILLKEGVWINGLWFWPIPDWCPLEDEK
jgi:hypothetical protein